MANQRTLRGIAGFLRARLDELGLNEVSDPRSNQGKRWKLEQVVAMVLLGLMAGCRGLAELEDLSGDTKGVIRRWLGIRGRLPDTTARSILCRLDPVELVPLLHRAVITAQHRQAWKPQEMPFGIVAMDGKGTSLPAWTGKYAQLCRPTEGIPYGLLRTVTSTLVTSRSMGCIDVSPIPAANNEMSHFGAAFESLVDNHASRFEMVSYDQGANSEDNAKLVLSRGKQYLFRLNDERRHMQQLAAELLATAEICQTDVEVSSRGDLVTRTLRLVRVNRGLLPKSSRKSELWSHAKTLLQVDTETEHLDGHRVTSGRRYFASSLSAEGLSPEQWLRATHWHWRVETTHQVLDTAFLEDKRPWIRADPNGMLVMMVLRRLAYTLLGLYRAVTQRADEKREVAWPRLMKQVNTTLVACDADTIAGLRPRHRRKKRVRKAIPQASVRRPAA